MDEFTERNRFEQYESEYFDESTTNFRIDPDDHCPVPDDFDSGNDFDELMKII